MRPGRGSTSLPAPQGPALCSWRWGSCLMIPCDDALKRKAVVRLSRWQLSMISKLVKTCKSITR